MNDDHGNCVTCGYPCFRRGGHAAWCERIAEANRAENLALRTAGALSLHEAAPPGHRCRR